MVMAMGVGLHGYSLRIDIAAFGVIKKLRYPIEIIHPI